MGVPEVKYKLIAFAISSFFAGIAGALFASFVGKLPPEQWSLILSVEFIAILLIGGVGTDRRHDARHVLRRPRCRAIVEQFVGLDERAGRPRAASWGDVCRVFVSSGADDFGFGLDGAHRPGLRARRRPRSTVVLYGLLIIVFLLFEPLGLYGIWVKVRNYWKGWPFSY